MARKTKRKTRLLPHEKALLQEGHLKNTTHERSSAIWLSAASAEEKDERTLCYRHMGDIELKYLRESGQLPATQPYQTLTRHQEGRLYRERYLRTNKTVDTNPTTVVEFDCSRLLVDKLYSVQSKIEDGTISHGLGHKAGRTLQAFNESLARSQTTWRIVLVKRR